jgi:rhamnosyltransferase
MKRIGFFVFFDPDGIVDDYVLYLLEHIKPFLNFLVVISNGELGLEQKNKLTRYGDLYIERINKGFDFGAWKEALLYHFSRSDLANYDELLFFNDTFYGPIISLDKIFDHFDNTSSGLWGLTRFGETIRNGQLYKPFIQTYFWGCKQSFF